MMIRFQEWESVLKLGLISRIVYMKRISMLIDINIS